MSVNAAHYKTVLLEKQNQILDHVSLTVPLRGCSIVPNHWSILQTLQFILIICRTKRLTLYLMMSHNVT